MSTASLWSRLFRGFNGTKNGLRATKCSLSSVPVLESLEGRLVPTTAIFNPTGGTNLTDGIRVEYAESQFSIIRNGDDQLHDGHPNPNVNNHNGVFLTIGDDTTGGTVVANATISKLHLGANMNAVSWTNYATSSVTTPSGGTSNDFTFTSTMTYTNSAGLAYKVDLVADYTFPNQYFKESYTVTIPIGNTKDVRLFVAYDTRLGSPDRGFGFVETTGAPSVNNGVTEFGVTGANNEDTIQYVSGQAWEGYASTKFDEVVFSDGGVTTGPGFGRPYANDINPDPHTDNGLGVNWNFGSSAVVASPVSFLFQFVDTGSSVIDTTAPSAPLITSVSVDTGISTTDQITSDSTLTVTGTAEANSVVKIFDNGVLVGTTTASGTGAYSVTTSALADGTHSALTVKATDAAGNTSIATSLVTWVIDTTAPSAPLITSVSVDTGISTTDQITSDSTLTVTGTAEANSVVKIFDNGVLVGTTTASGTGAYSVTTSALADGTHSALTVTATDAAGNTGVATSLGTWLIDTSAPSAPLIGSVSVDTGISSTDQITSDSTLTVTGTAEANSVVKIFDNGVLVGTTTASGTGAYSVTTSALADGTHSALTVTATDAAGNTGIATSLGTWLIDTSAPSAPLIGSVSDDTGVSATDQITSDSTLTVTGTAEANSVVKIFDNGVLVGTTTASGTGAYSVTTSTLAGGTHSALTVTATDAAGNAGIATSLGTWVIESTAPSAPLITSVSVDTGISSTDQITMDGTLTVTGTAAANSVVKIFDNGVLVGTTTASGTGAYSVTTSALADGTHSALTVTATDAAGNTGVATSLGAWVIDTTAPVVGMIADSTDADGTYMHGQTLTIELTLDEVVFVIGNPRLNFNSGGKATYLSGSGTNTLVFTYLVQRGEQTPLGAPLKVIGFDRSSGSINDAAGNIPDLYLSSVANGNLDVNNQLIISSRLGVTLVPFNNTFIDNTVSPGFGKNHLASLAYLATFDQVVNNFPRSALQTVGLVLTSVFRVGDGTGMRWKIDAKPINPLGTLGATSIFIKANSIRDLFKDTNVASNVVTANVLRNTKITSTLSAGPNTAKVIGRTTTLSGLSVSFSASVDPSTVVSSAFNTFDMGTVRNIVVSTDRLRATFDLDIANGGTAFNAPIRVHVIDKVIQDIYGNTVKGSSQLKWTYDGRGATAVFKSTAAAQVKAGVNVEWTANFSEIVNFSTNHMTVTIGGVEVNSSQISVRGSGMTYKVTLTTTTELKGPLVVVMKSGSAGPIDLRGNELAIIQGDLATTIMI